MSHPDAITGVCVAGYVGHERFLHIALGAARNLAGDADVERGNGCGERRAGPGDVGKGRDTLRSCASPRTYVERFGVIGPLSYV
jgi:hypothetical protein